jgi:ATP phosphoribosyltransferase regulatory subunit
MNREEQWLLPDGVEEILPRQAQAVESLRRRLLDNFAGWGYQLVFPPLIEFLESLLNGAGRDLEHDTFKLIDQLSGRLMGVRADITPQVARMDAHSLRREGPVRLCYCSTALRARVDQRGGSRLPYQIGVELFGHAGFDSDAEVVGLLLDSLALASATNVTLELGHVGIFRALVIEAGLNEADIEQLSAIYQRKAATELADFIAVRQLPVALAGLLTRLPRLCGDASLLAQVRDTFAGYPDALTAVDELATLVGWVQASYPQVNIYLDLAELRGYHYHTGCVFAAYLPDSSEPVAKGGRYDHIGEVFGRARPATGFSADLKALAAVCPVTTQAGILARGDLRDVGFREAVIALRAKGERVVLALPGVTNDMKELRCDRCLEPGADGKPHLVSEK